MTGGRIPAATLDDEDWRRGHEDGLHAAARCMRRCGATHGSDTAMYVCARLHAREFLSEHLGHCIEPPLMGTVMHGRSGLRKADWCYVASSLPAVRAGARNGVGQAVENSARQAVGA